MKVIQLRPDQRVWIDTIRQHFSQGSKAPLGQAPTGFGKTVGISYVADGVARKGNRCCVLVHRSELIVQTSVALALMGVWHHIIAPSETIRAAVQEMIAVVGRSYFNADAPTGVASVQTLCRRLGKFVPYDFLLVDEAHHAVASQWEKIIAYHPAAYVLGVTATPQRMDGQGLGVHAGGCFTSMVLGPSVAELIENGYLAKPRVFQPPTQMVLKGLRKKGKDLDTGEAAKRLDKPSITGDVIKHYARICPGVPSIAFCASVEHAEHVALEFNAAGWRAASVDGNTDGGLRRKRIKALGDGHLDILTSCDIISEGTDVPRVGGAILLRPTQSLAMYLQQVGRALRRYPGKDFAYIIDHVGNSDDELHGRPEEDRTWSLDGRAQRKGKSASGRSNRTCMECYALYPATASACPDCGAVPKVAARQIETREGELVEVTGPSARQNQKYEFMRERDGAQTYEELVELGRRRRMDHPEAWARHVLNSRPKPKVPDPTSTGGTLL